MKWIHEMLSAPDGPRANLHGAVCRCVTFLPLLAFISTDGCGPTRGQLVRGELVMALIGWGTGAGLCGLGYLVAKKTARRISMSIGIALAFTALLFILSSIRCLLWYEHPSEVVCYEWMSGYASLMAFFGMGRCPATGMLFAFINWHTVMEMVRWCGGDGLEAMFGSALFMAAGYIAVFIFSFLFLLAGVRWRTNAQWIPFWWMIVNVIQTLLWFG